VAGYVRETGDVAGRHGFRSRNGWPGAADWVSRGSKRGGNADLGPTQTKPAVPGCQSTMKGGKGGITYLWGPTTSLITELHA